MSAGSPTAIPAQDAFAKGRVHAARNAASPRERIGWIDAARGLGIILVVAGHALGGLIDARIGSGQGGFRQAFYAIYTFHMPLFFILTGLLVPARIRQDRTRFLRRLIPGVLWPYFLWSAVQFSIIYLAGQLVNRPAGDYWTTLANLPWWTVSQFWFLYALFWMHLLAALALPRAGAFALLALGVTAKVAAATVLTDVSARLVANNLAWYALGAVLGERRWLTGIAALPLRRVAALAVCGAAAVGLSVMAASHGADRAVLAGGSSPDLAGIAWKLWLTPTALAGSAGVIAVASRPRLASSPTLALLGQRSMAIYLLHVLFVAGMRIALVHGNITRDPLAMLPVLIAIGIAGPLLVDRVIRHLGLNAWMGF